MVVYFLNKDSMFPIWSVGKHFFRTTYLLIIYLIILIKEIIIANFQVAGIVLSPKMNISPEVISFTTKLKSDFNKTILANSMTLTPGTITVLVENNTLTVHCLRKEYIEGVMSSKFEKILLKLEE